MSARSTARLNPKLLAIDRGGVVKDTLPNQTIP